MKKKFEDSLEKIISQKRIDGYKRRMPSPGALDLYTSYALNIALSESLYTPLQAIEISLRNSIHNAASQHYGGNGMWFDKPTIIFDRKQKQKIFYAKQTLTNKNKNLSSGRIIAELGFGFWTSLFNSGNHQFWPPILKQTFPNMTNRKRTRKLLSKRLNKIRRLRNRVFHYEPIWYYGDLYRQYTEIMETINWIEPAMADLVEAISNFPSSYSQTKRDFIKNEIHKFC